MLALAIAPEADGDAVAGTDRLEMLDEPPGLVHGDPELGRPTGATGMVAADEEAAAIGADRDLVDGAGAEAAAGP